MYSAAHYFGGGELDSLHVELSAGELQYFDVGGQTQRESLAAALSVSRIRVQSDGVAREDGSSRGHWRLGGLKLQMEVPAANIDGVSFCFQAFTSVWAGALCRLHARQGLAEASPTIPRTADV